jgi:hypothetical protein
VLRRPVELAAVTGEVELAENQLSGKTTNQELHRVRCLSVALLTAWNPPLVVVSNMAE